LQLLFNQPIFLDIVYKKL